MLINITKIIKSQNTSIKLFTLLNNLIKGVSVLVMKVKYSTYSP